MRLVDYVQPGSPRAGHDAHTVPEVADLVDAAIRGGVDLKDIGRPAFGDLTAGQTFVARLAVAQRLTIYHLRQQARGGCLAGAARPAEEIGMRQPTIADGL